MSDTSDTSDDETYEPSANVGISCPEYSFTRGLKGTGYNFIVTVDRRLSYCSNWYYSHIFKNILRKFNQYFPFTLIDLFDNEADWCILFRDNLSYLFELINKMCGRCDRARGRAWAQRAVFNYRKWKPPLLKWSVRCITSKTPWSPKHKLLCAQWTRLMLPQVHRI